MSKITRVELRMITLEPKVKRTDAIQSFICQETPIVTIHDSDGASGTGYSYTIGTGGPAIMALLEHSLAPALIGRDAQRIDWIWQDLLFSTHATAVGAITSLALAAIDIALWDLRCVKAGLPLWKAVGGAQERIPLYSTEGGWLHLEPQALVEDALAVKEKGFGGSKLKIGRARLSEDAARIAAVRDAVGDAHDIMIDANQGFTLCEAIRRGRMLADHGVLWFEEPLPADDIQSHLDLSRRIPVPVAIGESLYSLSQFKDYLTLGAAQVVQVDVARIGGITPWLKTANLAHAHNIAVCPHFLMELHLPLTCGTANARWLEYIPQLDEVTTESMSIIDGYGIPSNRPGLGIAWDWPAIRARELTHCQFTQ